jgi:hypothetical protein
MTWRDEENERAAARLRRWAEFEEEHRALPTTMAPYPAALDSQGWSRAPRPKPPVSADGPSEKRQPGEVLLGLLAKSADPLTARETGRDQAAAEHADLNLDGREAARQLGVHRNPDGSNLSGSAAKARMLEIHHHWDAL